MMVMVKREQDIEDATEFTYLGPKVTKDGNTEAEIKTSVKKAKGASLAFEHYCNITLFHISSI